jgi:hypothetical protein
LPRKKPAKVSPARRIQILLYEESNQFQENLELEEESPRQDLRGAFIGWFMVFAPELVPKNLVDEIATYMTAPSISPPTLGSAGTVPIELEPRKGIILVSHARKVVSVSDKRPY